MVVRDRCWCVSGPQLCAAGIWLMYRRCAAGLPLLCQSFYAVASPFVQDVFPQWRARDLKEVAPTLDPAGLWTFELWATVSFSRMHSQISSVSMPVWLGPGVPRRRRKSGGPGWFASALASRACKAGSTPLAGWDCLVTSVCVASTKSHIVTSTV